MPGKFRGIDLEEGWMRRELADVKRDLAELAAARRLGLQSVVVQVNLDPLAIATAWTDYGVTAITPPVGYNVALIQMLATAGVSWPSTAGGNVGVQPCAGAASGVGQSQGGSGASGHGAGCSVTGILTAKLAVVGGTPFNLFVRSYANAGYTVNTGNVRYGASIIYTRE